MSIYSMTYVRHDMEWYMRNEPVDKCPDLFRSLPHGLNGIVIVIQGLLQSTQLLTVVHQIWGRQTHLII